MTFQIFKKKKKNFLEIFKFYFFKFFFKVGVIPKEGQTGYPSIMTTTQDIRDLFAYHSPNVYEKGHAAPRNHTCSRACSHLQIAESPHSGNLVVHSTKEIIELMYFFFFFFEFTTRRVSSQYSVVPNITIRLLEIPHRIDNFYSMTMCTFHIENDFTIKLLFCGG